MKAMLFIISIILSQTVAAERDADLDASLNTALDSALSEKRKNELLYFVRQDCGSCHGMTLKGGLGPALLPQTLSVQPKSFLVHTIMEGRENTAMPPWKSMLTLQEASWIVDQLQQGINGQTQMALKDKPMEKP